MKGDVNMKHYTEENIYSIIDSLPHGSGFNSRWEHKIDTRGKLHLYQTYDYMDENGFYDTYIDFEVVIYKNDFKIHFLHVTNHQKYIIYTHMLREYFGDVFGMWFWDNKNLL